jgi:4-aminobutyrate aminotransferase
MQDFPPGEKSKDLLSQLKKVIANPNYSGLYGISIKEGNDVYFKDFDGFTYLDCLAAASTNCLGYSYPGIAETYAQVASTMQHSCFLYSPNEHALKLATKLIQISPGNFPKKVMFGLSGSDACDGAIKAARKYTRNLGIIHFKNDYHGSTGLSMPASDYSTLNTGIFEHSQLFNELSFPSNQAEMNNVLEQIETMFKSHKALTVIAETFQGDAGVQVPPKDFFKQLSSLTKKYQGILIIDEVQSGMGRTGFWWAIEHENVEPDILVTAKSLSGGFAPISAAIGRAEVLDSLENGQHLFTYSGHAPSAAVALKIIETIEQNKLIEHAHQMGTMLMSKLYALKNTYNNIIVDVRGKGLMIGIEINIMTDSLAGKVFATRCVEKGLYVGFFGVNGEVIRIEPPLIIKQNHVQEILRIIEEVALEMQNGTIPEQTYTNVKTYSIGI